MKVDMGSTEEKHAIIGNMAGESYAIKTSAAAFRILSDGLYSNKILAVVREVTCNAWDSHIEADKQDVPIDIVISESEFIVKDYGVGIPHDKITDIYTSYFGTTKEENDGVTGGFGLGSKAPFAYTDNFIVTNIYDGIKRTYVARISSDKHGVPEFVKMNEGKTEECNGLEVMVPLKEKSDAYYFSKELRSFMYASGINANIYTDREKTKEFSSYYKIPIDFSEKKAGEILLIEGKEFLDRKTLPLFSVKIGSVIYSIEDFIKENSSDFPFINFVFKQKNYSGNGKDSYNLMLLAEPSKIGITPSRESISFDENTKKYLFDTLGKFEKKCSESLEQLDKKWDEYVSNFDEDNILENIETENNNWKLVDFLIKEKIIVASNKKNSLLDDIGNFEFITFPTYYNPNRFFLDYLTKKADNDSQRNEYSVKINDHDAVFYLSSLYFINNLGNIYKIPRSKKIRKIKLENNKSLFSRMSTAFPLFLKRKKVFQKLITKSEIKNADEAAKIVLKNKHSFGLKIYPYSMRLTPAQIDYCKNNSYGLSPFGYEGGLLSYNRIFVFKNQAQMRQYANKYTDYYYPANDIERITGSKYLQFALLKSYIDKEEYKVFVDNCKRYGFEIEDIDAKLEYKQKKKLEKKIANGEINKLAVNAEKKKKTPLDKQIDVFYAVGGLENPNRSIDRNNKKIAVKDIKPSGFFMFGNVNETKSSAMIRKILTTIPDEFPVYVIKRSEMTKTILKFFNENRIVNLTEIIAKDLDESLKITKSNYKKIVAGTLLYNESFFNRRGLMSKLVMAKDVVQNRINNGWSALTSFIKGFNLSSVEETIGGIIFLMKHSYHFPKFMFGFNEKRMSDIINNFIGEKDYLKHLRYEVLVKNSYNGYKDLTGMVADIYSYENDSDYTNKYSDLEIINNNHYKVYKIINIIQQICFWEKLEKYIEPHIENIKKEKRTNLYQIEEMVSFFEKAKRTRKQIESKEDKYLSKDIRKLIEKETNRILDVMFKKYDELDTDIFFLFSANKISMEEYDDEKGRIRKLKIPQIENMAKFISEQKQSQLQKGEVK